MSEDLPIDDDAGAVDILQLDAIGFDHSPNENPGHGKAVSATS